MYMHRLMNKTSQVNDCVYADSGMAVVSGKSQADLLHVLSILFLKKVYFCLMVKGQSLLESFQL